MYGILDMISAKLSEFMPESLEEEVLGVAEVKQLFPGPRGLDGACHKNHVFAVISL